MVRIANGTTIQTPQGLANVTYTQITSTTAQGQTTSEYDRTITIANHPDKVRITSNFQGTQIPASDTLLGLLMRDSYPSSIAAASQPSSDTNDIGLGAPGCYSTHSCVHFFTQAFQSSNKYVIVYKLNAGQNPQLTAAVNPSYIPKNGSTNITGTLTEPSGVPITGANVTLQFSTDGGARWSVIGNSPVASNGAYTFTKWVPPVSTTSTIYVRAYYPGDPTRKLNFAYSAPQPLTEH
jgi:hypothetical protein